MTRYSDPRPTAVCDSECYIDYWSIAFRDVASDRMRLFELHSDSELDRVGIAKLIRNWRIVTFNGNNYDMPMLAYAMAGATTEQLKGLSDEIIVGGLRSWQVEERYGCSLPRFLDHIDLIEVAPGQASLKIYGGRLHSRRMQDLPIEPHERIGASRRPLMRSYLGNDLQTTVDLYDELLPQIELRAKMSDEFSIDLRSKSDAQIAEAVIRSKLEALQGGQRIYRPEVRPGLFRYKAPAFIQFQTSWMRDFLDRIAYAPLTVLHNGTVEMPPLLAEAKISMGGSVFRMGIGGLHSSESSVAHHSDDEYVLLDRDCASFYPAIILICRLMPKHLGEAFLHVYKGIVDRRLAAKRSGDKVTAEALKITVNGSFGKLGSPWSVLYSPELMIQTTLTGQLVLLMLIESLTLRGFQVISANTDGIVTKVRRSERALFDAVVWDWEVATGFVTEETEYTALYSASVNAYIAFQPNGKVKLKGPYAPSGRGQPAASGLKKNPNAEVCIDAVVAYLKDGVPVETTIEDCTDVRKFVAIRTVKGGAEKDGELIGKAIRYIHSTDSPGAITYRTNGNRVPMTEGCRPLMELPDELPDDICYDHYIREAYAILADLGAGSYDPALAGRSGTVLARLPDAKNIHLVELPAGVALCGSTPKSLRDRWQEYSVHPDGHRMCSKCKRENEL